MSTPLISLEIGASYQDVVDLMIAKNISTVPVTDNGKLAGLFTRRSLIQTL
jgi:CBS domain-containing protein